MAWVTEPLTRRSLDDTYRPYTAQRDGFGEEDTKYASHCGTEVMRARFCIPATWGHTQIYLQEFADEDKNFTSVRNSPLAPLKVGVPLVRCDGNTHNPRTGEIGIPGFL